MTKAKVWTREELIEFRQMIWETLNRAEDALEKIDFLLVENNC